MKSTAFSRMNCVRAMVLTLALLTSWSGHASTVMQMDFAEVTGVAQLIFEGKVAAVESREVPNGTIHTFVTLEIVEVLKGNYPGNEIELSFLGGTVGGRRVQVTDLQIPMLGETGFYFVESVSAVQVNPLVGWAQGHYLIESAPDGSEVVTTATHEPIVTLDAVPKSGASKAFSKGAATGVVTQKASPLAQAMTAQDFRNSVLAIAAQAR